VDKIGPETRVRNPLHSRNWEKYPRLFTKEKYRDGLAVKREVGGGNGAFPLVKGIQTCVPAGSITHMKAGVNRCNAEGHIKKKRVKDSLGKAQWAGRSQGNCLIGQMFPRAEGVIAPRKFCLLVAKWLGRVHSGGGGLHSWDRWEKQT